jgi:hypothetical protein
MAALINLMHSNMQMQGCSCCLAWTQPLGLTCLLLFLLGHACMHPSGPAVSLRVQNTCPTNNTPDNYK